ncbi:MAG: ABC transporter ATP-binding protein [Desulfatitalea sp.]
MLFLLQVAVACIEMAGIASIMPFMAVVANPNMIQTNRWLKQAYEYLKFDTLQSFLFFLGVLLLGLMVLSNLSKALLSWTTLKFDNGLNYKLARKLLSSYLARPYEFFLNRNTAEIGKNVLAEVRTVIAGVLGAGMSVMSNVLICLFILALIMVVDAIIAITIIVILGGCYGLIYALVRTKLNRIGREQVESNRQKYKAAGEVLGGIKDLKILGRELVFLEKFAAHALRHSKNNITAGVIAQLPKYALEVIAFGGILLMVLSFLGDKQEAGHMIPLLALYAFAGYRLLPALQLMFSGVTTVRFNLASLELLHRDLTEIGSKAEPEQYLKRSGCVEPMPFTRELELRNITFTYSGAPKPSVQGLSLKIPVNTTVGFVGATGSGKTTTVDIVLGLLAPSAGQLVADGRPVHGEDNLAGWQRNLGYVPQAIFLSDDSVARNIAFGVPEHEINMEGVVRAARIAHLSDFIEKELPEQYNTVIGERGVRLSGGQRQRIGIARALYRDPSVLILDEATSALDGVTEEAVMVSIRDLSQKKTIIIIAHRLTTVKECDIIYIMDRGKIVGQGTYSELQKSSDWFREAARTGVPKKLNRKSA